MRLQMMEVLRFMFLICRAILLSSPPPGLAMLFITVNGVPSVGQWVMVGCGSIGTQPTQGDVALPDSYIPPGLAVTTS